MAEDAASEANEDAEVKEGGVVEALGLSVEYLRAFADTFWSDLEAGLQEAPMDFVGIEAPRAITVEETEGLLGLLDELPKATKLGKFEASRAVRIPHAHH